MTPPVFVHLRCHSEYSIADGMVRLDAYVQHAVQAGMPAVALTDLSNLFGAVKFYTAARSQGVKPLLGCEFWVENPANRDQPFRLLVLCQNHDGYLALCDLLSRAHLENQHRGRAEIRREWLAARSAGLILLSGAGAGDVGQALLQGNLAQARTLAAGWREIFGDRYYLEVQRADHAQQEALIARTVALAGELDVPVVATHPIQFLDRADFTAHEVRTCIAEGYVLPDKRRPRLFTQQQYFTTQEEMAQRFSDLPSALAQSVEIAKRCNLTLTLGKPDLPQFPTPQGEALDAYLADQARAGLAQRLDRLYPDPEVRAARRGEYEARLESEVGIIGQMGFSGYFLIVADFIHWAKTHGVPVGPGRGSGAGSLVAYSLGITDLDPLRYALLFERFLNPERVSMPDFDIDFCQDGRDRVIDYVKSRYGAEAVSQIATFGTLAAKAVIRDVGRVLDLPFNFVDGIAKLIPNELGISLSDALEKEPQLKARRDSEEEVATLLELALRLEGLVRNVGMHAGGVLIAPRRIADYTPMYCQQGSDSVVSQYDKDDVEAVGLVKFDFLGLRTLTILALALDHTNARRGASGQPSLTLEGIPLDDAATFDLLKSANTTAVFQLESRGMKDMLKQARPDRFEDIIALVALYRPGPMDLIPDFCRRKHGLQKVDYPHPATVPLLKETYGIMVYQEQVMQMAQVVAGYSLGGADMLRRAMGKKKPEEMARQRATFVSGAQHNGTSERAADALFDLMERFSGYGFNKSHAAAYALLAYQTAYLKRHDPASFLAATLSSDMNNTDNVHVFYDDCLANGLEVLPPDINRSGYRFEPLDDQRILYGLGAVKGVGWAAIENILAAREQGGPFRDLFDFCSRLDLRRVNRRVIESLICAGAFDALTSERAALFAGVGMAIEAATLRSAASGQNSLFGDSPEEAGHTLPRATSWTEQEKLQREKAALGFYLSGHPFLAHRKELAAFVRGKLADLAPKEAPQLLAGIVVGLRRRVTSRGTMVFVTLDDATARIEVAVGGELLSAHAALLKEDGLLFVEGRVAHDEYSGGLRVSARRLFDLATARSTYATLLKLSCNGQADALRLRDLLVPYCQAPRGEAGAAGCPVQVEYQNGAARVALALGDAWRVDLRDELLAGLRGWLTEGNVTIVYPR